MSSILKALKKLEGEQTGQEKVQSLSAAVHLKKSKRGNSASFRRTPSFAGLAVVIVFLVVTGGFAVKYAGRKAETTVAEIKNDNTQDGVNPAISPVVKKRENAPFQVEKTLRKPETRSSGKKNPPVLEEAKIQPDKPHANPDAKANEKIIQKADQMADDNLEAPATRKQPEAVVIPSPVFAEPDEKNFQENTSSPLDASETDPEDSEGDIEILEDDSLKLMAIAWSDDPKSRIAVINDRILREGDAAEGMTVYRINEEAVILRKGGDTWKLLFRLK